MLGGKTHSQTRPTALGTMLNASTYGATIPTIYGTTRSALLAIWAANLRKGGSSKKAKKKGITTYVENVDFLIGSNPIDGCLRMWLNNTGAAPLNFVNLVVSYPPSTGYTIVDPHFYFLVAVTVELLLTGTFNDYGNPDGASAYSVTQELPLWNLNAHGPDLINAAGSRWWPWVYDWKPSYGNVVKFPQWASPASILGANGNVHFYYAQTTSKTKFMPPIAYNRLAFESQLGSGTEYSDAGLSSQQIIYPHYAGLGSSDIDLGASAMLPDMRVEVRGSFALYPSGDADFADMIEDVIKSGQVQVDSELGLIQRGVNCNDLPGPVQRASYNSNEQTSPIITKFSQANRAGSYLICFSRWQRTLGGGTTPTILDDAADSWTHVILENDVGLWYAQSVGAAAGNKVEATYNGIGGSYHPEQMIFELDPASDTLEDTDAAILSTAPGSLPEVATLSVTVTKPALLLLFIDTIFQGWDSIYAVSPHWENITPWEGMRTMEGGYPYGTVWKRTVAAAGTYSVDVTFNLTSAYRIGLMAFSQSQASMLPKTLGNILDPVTMQQTRNQCRANGLIGSISLDSQRKASEWLKEFYQCANAAPVWSGFKLKSIPYSEVSAVGNGTLYTAPTAAGPVATLTESDLVGDPNKPIITVERVAQVDTGNVRQVEHINRDNDYNVSTVSEPESGGIAIFGPRKQSPVSLHEIQDSAVARKLLSIAVRRFVYLRNSYKFTMHARWIVLEAMDLILINDSQLNIVNLPVRLTSVKETETFDLECEAEPFYYGVNAPDDLDVTTASPNNQDSGITPAQINVPLMVEVPLKMCASGKPELWIAVSDPDPLYGGALVYVSTDNGVSYNPIGTTAGNATTGSVVSDWPAAADPDSTNDLLVDLSESNGTLASYDTTDENNSVFPCYVGTVEYDPTSTPTYISSAEHLDPGGPDLWNPPACPGTPTTFPVPTGITGDSCVLQFLHVDGATLPTTDQPLIAIASKGAIQTVTYGRLPPGCLPPAVWQFSGGYVFINDMDLGGFHTEPYELTLNYSTGEVVDFAWMRVAASATETLTLGSVSATFTMGSAGGVICLAKVSSEYGHSVYVVVAVGSGFTVPAPFTLRGSAGVFVWGDLVSSDGNVPAEPYELMTYAVANLTSANHYTLKATGTGNFLRRSVFGMPTPGIGVDHPASRRFAWLDSWQNNPNPPGILKSVIDPGWIGKQLYFKFLQLNALHGGSPDLADVAVYTYTPTGLVIGGGTVGDGSGAAGAPQPSYTLTGGALTNPASNEIDMASATAAFSTGTSIVYAARVFTIPVPSTPTTYYVTVYDPTQSGDGGSTAVLTAQCQTSNALVGVPGYVYIGSIVAIPGGSGTVTVPGGWPPLEQILVNGQ
jgi:hypothetical protein